MGVGGVLTLKTCGLELRVLWRGFGVGGIRISF